MSHALAGGRALAEVKAAAGDSTLTTTSVYLHIAFDNVAREGKLFAFRYNEAITEELG